MASGRASVALWLVVGTAAVLAQAKHARAQAQASAAICSQLSAGVDSYAPVASYRAYGPGAADALIACFEREDVPRHARLRALEWLAHLPSPRVERLFRSLLRAAQTRSETPSVGDPAPPLSHSVATVRRALLGLLSLGARVTDAELAPCLAHSHVGVRLAAVQLLAQQPDGSALLQKQRARETSPPVKKALERALRDRSARP
jgi:hypothetical protein